MDSLVPLLFYFISQVDIMCDKIDVEKGVMFISEAHSLPSSLFHRLRCIEWDISRSFLLRLGLTIFSIVLIFTMAQVNAVRIQLCSVYTF